MRQNHINLFGCLQVLTYLSGVTLTTTTDPRNSNSNFSAVFKNPFLIYPNFKDKRTPDLIKMLGYPVEVHDITTEDGYILTVFRIPYSNISLQSPNKIPAFCLHGAALSSAHWFWQPPQRALVLMLVDAGYDVWIGNSRGTSYSQKHVSFPINNKKDLRFWNYSMHEFSEFDVPAVINYITNYTSQPNIYWIGHSMGVGQFFAGMSLHPELNVKVRTTFAIAPANYLGNMKNVFIRAISPIYSKYKFQQFANQFGAGRLVPSPFASLLAALIDFCQIPLINWAICSNVLNILVGYSSQQNLKALPGILAHTPDDMSTKLMSHFLQLVETGKFRQYDYGQKILNQKHYGCDTPPDYNWSKIDVPVVLYHSELDNLVVLKDVKKTVKALGSNVKEVHNIPNFTHLDFVVGDDADKFIYNNILETMNSKKYDRV